MSLFYGYGDKIDIEDLSTKDDDISSKKYTDIKLSKSGGMISCDLGMNLYKLKTYQRLSIIQTQFQNYT